MMANNNKELRKSIVSILKLNSFSIRGNACDYLTETLSALDEKERFIWLDKIIDHFQKQSLDAPVIEKEHIEAAILESSKNEIDEEDDIIRVISAFDVPQFEYSLERKKFLPCKHKTPELYGKSSSKGSLFKDRYTIIYQRTLRNRLFHGVGDDEGQFKLRPVEYLLTVTSKITDVVILGLLTQLKEGRYYLEDPSGIIQVDLSNTTYHDGLFTECCFVLAEGWYQDGVLHVQAMGLPPREISETSRVYFGSENTFGGPSKTSLKNNERLKGLELHKEDAMLVFLSDVWLDVPKVLDKLSQLFLGYSTCPPAAFVLMGNFQSGHKGFQHWSCLKDGFKTLGELVSQWPSIAQNSKFIIIPGPTDSQAANILPRPELPETIVSGLKTSVKDVVLATNPCRIQYCTQEIVLVREDLVTKLCRNSVHFPDMKDIGSHFAKTLICQAHLVPLCLNVCPVYWEFDSALRLYPCPDLVVVGDQQKEFSVKYNQCHVINPGPFCKGNFAFKVYYPATKEIEDCQIPDE
ncbi:DNA polymerase epsilon subunit 2 [Halyomorpha halys]|uniref:DNA polymerase epsilon subunit 2 n=1 Tax=Halyomorpha halys TaxID=286706 RepID=UPI0006D4CD22|nr:DNA polymerase epsilon subunit 2 [Halyomorpha halys]